MKAGFIGLGVMGAPMALNLAKAGVELAVYDVSADALATLKEAGAVVVSTPADCALGADAVITMLPNSEIVREVVLGSGGVAETLSSSAVFVDMSTGSVGDCLSLGKEFEGRGLAFVDAPVGRTPWDAQAGTLLILMGGSSEAKKRARPFMEILGNEIIDAGEAGNGMRLKVVNNYMTVVGAVLAAETLALGRKVGLDRDVVMKTLAGTVAGKGPINVLYPKKALAGDLTPLFSAALAQKDLLLALELATDEHVRLGLGEKARDVYRRMGDRNMLQQDMTALLPLLESEAGLSSQNP